MRILRIDKSNFNYVESPETLTGKGLKDDIVVTLKKQ